MKSSLQHRMILLTGAAGRIGSAFFQDTDGRYRFRLAERRIDSLRAAAAALQFFPARRNGRSVRSSCRVVVPMYRDNEGGPG